VGWLITRLTSDCDRLARVVAWGFSISSGDAAYVVMIAASLLVMNWKLGLIVVAVVPPLAVISKVLPKKDPAERTRNPEVQLADHRVLQRSDPGCANDQDARARGGEPA
jgi:ABC-type multidrug transport system fused ATPase/permease subunit